MSRLQVWIMVLGFLCGPLNAQQDPLQAADSAAQAQWVEDTYARMDPARRVGQLFMLMAHSDQGPEWEQRLHTWVKEYHIGGLVFSTGGPVRQARLTNALQQEAEVPLLIAMDAEWGLAMRLDSTYAFPWNTTLGAIRDSALLEEVGYAIGSHAARLGVHMNFAPVADTNTNPDNPIIGNRSLGEDPEAVGRKARYLMQGMHRAGILTSGKHFPGHGDTSVDSHKALPQIPFGRERLDTVEIRPFRDLIEAGLSSVMIAHLNVPSLTGSETLPTSLSESLIRNTLQGELGFRGLVVTDALNMKGVAAGEAGINTSLSAFLAGNDLLLMPTNLEADHAALLEAYRTGLISEQRLAYSVKKILRAKYKAGLARYTPVEADGIYEDLNRPQNDALYETAIEAAITVLKNQVSILGIRNLENKKIAYVKLGDADHTPFLETLRLYTAVDEVSGETPAQVLEQLADYNLVIIGMHQSNASPWKAHHFSAEDRELLEAIAALRTSNSILTVFARPYILGEIPSYENVDGLVMAYQNSPIAQQTAAELLFGALPARGRLPVSAHPDFPAGSGLEVPALLRLGYSYPERVGLSREGLACVDTLMQHGMDSLMFPGAQLLIARHGKVVFHKAYGGQTYEGERPVALTDVYDLASLTKILATLPLLMQMEESGSLRLNDTFSDLIPEYAQTELRDVTVLKALSHYGRLPSWIAFYLDTLNKNRRPSTEFYTTRPQNGYSIQVADKLYLTDAYRDSIYNRIGRQELKSNRYRYSDVAYYVFKKYIEETRGHRLDSLATEFLYAPLGASRTAFNPLKHFPRPEIVPTEQDDYYRYQEIRGYVHDMGAAMQGGVGGHAGLFANANDVAKIMQMYLQGGYYGGTRFLQSRTIEKFNKCYFCGNHVRRGVGFDKPQLEDPGPTCGCVSPRSFGHSGFTGTYTWADPDAGIVYVFLSNRTYPKSSNTLLIRSALRTRIQQAIYDSIKD
ncbi:glycoside hydrolase family 3 N-terminal domain-containing protein [Robiginitalea sp. M366]|uniref:glycoside hydrolase family 3 N-terminal domain-containing protein n=1 Tax=Robiginitalea aestuariiviva TaxID=3036903 RepID=UPI00240D1802|nr:glycoside hydrolase family 3 N-terminal domain-containing protein [Robiginitalea aestuariiviva]MDG1572708.1 glycoside hydrolase family 3 N-terminal domain-containing protein [Robiginitalea aestuariiviva]